MTKNAELKEKLKATLKENDRISFPREKVPNTLHPEVEKLAKRSWLTTTILFPDRDIITLLLDILPWFVALFGVFGMLINNLHGVPSDHWTYILFGAGIVVGVLIWLYRTIWVRWVFLRAVEQKSYSLTISAREKGKYLVKVGFRDGEEAAIEI